MHKKIIKNSLLFDAAWYCKTYGYGEYLDAAEHYLNIGWREGKNPSAFFSTSDYLKKNPDVAAAGMNPLLHFEIYGLREGRYRAEIKSAMPAILARHPECKSEFGGGLLRVRITNACNAKCRYCGVRLTFGEEVNHAMDADWLYENLKPLYSSPAVILITGGDAFFAKESYKFMKFLSENFPKVTVMTESNGIAFSEKFQDLACENLFHTHFSLNASNAEIFAKSCWDSDDSATAKKIFPLILRNLKSYLAKLQAEDKICFAPDLSMVINKDNADDILNFVELAIKLRAGFVVFFFDYTENDMTSEYFKNPEKSRPALKTLMELERVLAEKFLIYFRLWIPTKEAEILQQEVEATPIDALNQKYAKFLELAKERSITGEFEKRNAIRRANGKAELDFVNDISPTLHLKKNVAGEICSAPWDGLDITPSGAVNFCCFFESTLNIKNFIDENNRVNWAEILNSFEYASVRYRILNEDFRGCQVGCPLNSATSPIAAVTKFNLDRKINQKKCACCGAEIENYLPMDENFLQILRENNFNFDVAYEMLNLREYTCPNCGSADRERAFALVMKKILNPNKKIRILDIAPRPCITDFIKKNFPRADYKTADLFMQGVDFQVDIMDMKEIASGSVDFFICSHILEHVADDIKAMQELRRILSDDGCGIVVVPLDLKRAEIDEDPNCTDVAERWRRFGQDDHVRAYSKAGFLQRLKSVGFTVTEYDKNFFGEKLMAENGLIATSVVYVVRK
ncbi:MAG: radical SAM protein [Selenomonadaceae bacterium]|nr:radical SAM protein [Selenomonadaceae bacterium]